MKPILVRIGVPHFTKRPLVVQLCFSFERFKQRNLRFCCAKVFFREIGLRGLRYAPCLPVIKKVTVCFVQLGGIGSRT